MKKINSTLIMLLGIVVVIIGLKLTSMSSGPAGIQNDGYNVSGGFIAALGGLLLGYWLATKDKKK